MIFIKKLLVGMLSLVMCFALVGCNSSNDETKNLDGGEVASLNKALGIVPEETVETTDETYEDETETETEEETSEDDTLVSEEVEDNNSEINE